MNEFSIYGKDGLFHNIVKQSGVMQGRYAVIKSGHDLNMNNLISSIELPKEGDKYPGVFCLPPVSEPDGWERFDFRLLFLCRDSYTGDNKLKSPDPLTNTSTHSAQQDWNDMNAIANGFFYALENILFEGFRLMQGVPRRVVRIANMQNDNVNGVLVYFSAQIAGECEYEDINIGAIDLNINNHQPHLH